MPGTTRWRSSYTGSASVYLAHAEAPASEPGELVGEVRARLWAKRSGEAQMRSWGGTLSVADDAVAEALRAVFNGDNGLLQLELPGCPREAGGLFHIADPGDRARRPMTVTIAHAGAPPAGLDA